MIHVFMFAFGLAGGGFLMYLILLAKSHAVYAEKRKQDETRSKLREAVEKVKTRTAELEKREAEFSTRQKLESSQLLSNQEAFAAKAVSYNELEVENTLLKRDLRNLDIQVRKVELDRDLQKQAQETLDQRCGELGSRYLKENIKWIGSSLSTNNFVNCKQRLLDVIERCRGLGQAVSAEEEASLIGDLKTEFERMVRAEFEREEQARIRAQIREEEKLKREIDRELKQLERERAAIQAALEKALAEAQDQHSAEIERLKARLAEAEAKQQRAISQAQLTKAGHIYVISNIGSFGDDVFKIGMTRRLEPQDRVRELGDASVPFPFDIHMMISCLDAPKLENALHRAFHKSRLNKMRPRKEFFRANIEAIRKIVLENHGEVQYVADPEALEYRQSTTMSEEDSEYIEEVYEAAEESGEPTRDAN